MKKLFLLLAAAGWFLIQTSAFTMPDEGMWLPMFVERLNYVDMQKMGLQLTAEEIYSINQSSLKDAVVGLSSTPTPNGFFCTGGITSDKGLLFTNHHCGYDIIQQHSSLEHDYLTDGFWASNLSEELVNENLTVSFFIRMENVTDSIVPFLSDTLSPRDRSAKIREISGRLEEAASGEGKYHVVVQSFFEGNEYYLFVYEVYRDVRLVGAPPSAIGKFGGETDNWMWPRHTGDFSIFRVYCAPDGSPADYAEDNVPLKPKHFLPFSIAGVNKDDFAMIWGYPGGTNRYMTSYGVKYTLETYNPTLIALLGTQLDVWREAMAEDDAVRIKYASKFSGYSNFWKLMIGQNRGLKRLRVYDKKVTAEEAFNAWVEQDPERKELYGQVLDDIRNGYESVKIHANPLFYVNFGLMGPEIIGFARNFGGLEAALEVQKDNPDGVAESVESLREDIEAHFKDYDAATDQRATVAMFDMFLRDMAPEYHPASLSAIRSKYKGDTEKYVSDLFARSVFADRARLETFLDNPRLKTLQKDPAYLLMNEAMAMLMGVAGTYREGYTMMSGAERLFMAGLREMYPGKVFYPDANSTMRLTYGSVQDYQAADAVHYDYVTTAEGILEKEDPGNEEFIVPERLSELIREKDFGRYGENGTLVTCFLTTNDITGGNSGSPVINGKGELIGLAFDGNWEAMSGDIAFEPELQRTICVDARYILFIMDKFAEAQNLVDELTVME
ncbi:MAG: S46 family peptidase [Bacteroidales bacterium]|nr:S46 family peptidase [Bacteroidales bacterium]